MGSENSHTCGSPFWNSIRYHVGTKSEAPKKYPIVIRPNIEQWTFRVQLKVTRGKFGKNMFGLWFRWVILADLKEFVVMRRTHATLFCFSFVSRKSWSLIFTRHSLVIPGRWMLAINNLTTLLLVEVFVYVYRLYMLFSSYDGIGLRFYLFLHEFDSDNGKLVDWRCECVLVIFAEPFHRIGKTLLVRVF